MANSVQGIVREKNYIKSKSSTRRNKNNLENREEITDFCVLDEIFTVWSVWNLAVFQLIILTLIFLDIIIIQDNQNQNNLNGELTIVCPEHDIQK